MNDEQMPPSNLIRFEMGLFINVDCIRELILILEGRLKKEENFGIIIVREGEQSNVPAVRKLFIHWLKYNKPLLRKYCCGVAMVAASEGMQKIYKPVAKLMILKMFGCSGELFAREEDAVAWLLNRPISIIK